MDEVGSCFADLTNKQCNSDWVYLFMGYIQIISWRWFWLSMVISGRLQYFRPILATKVNVGADSLTPMSFSRHSRLGIHKYKPESSKGPTKIEPLSHQKQTWGLKFDIQTDGEEKHIHFSLTSFLEKHQTSPFLVKWNNISRTQISLK